MLDIQIAKPCAQTWTAMTGDDQVRFCGACRKNVYNIAAMTEREVGELIQRTEGRFCARVYRRTDGRVLTTDCPKGVARVRRRRTLAVTAAVGALVGVLHPLFQPAATQGAVRVRFAAPKPPEEPIGYTTGLTSVPIYRKDVSDVRMGEIERIPRRP